MCGLAPARRPECSRLDLPPPLPRTCARYRRLLRLLPFRRYHPPGRPPSLSPMRILCRAFLEARFRLPPPHTRPSLAIHLPPAPARRSGPGRVNHQLRQLPRCPWRFRTSGVTSLNGCGVCAYACACAAGLDVVLRFWPRGLDCVDRPLALHIHKRCRVHVHALSDTHLPRSSYTYLLVLYISEQA